MENDFQNWLGRFANKAQRNGISQHLFEHVFADVSCDVGVISKDNCQPENSLQIWEYLDAAMSPNRTLSGKIALKENGLTLEEISTEFGVSKEILVAIWGLESAYGSFKGEFSVIRSLATLAFEGRRRGLYESELIAALKILQSGNVKQQSFVGSWAGAMGHTQFMPTSFLAHAVDFNDDGKCNIWGNSPVDALASTGSFLDFFGWVADEPCLVEIKLGAEFDYLLAQPDVWKSSDIWREFNVPVTPDSKFPTQIVVPAGANGPAFMVYENFRVLLKYNRAVPYAFAVALLAQSLAGKGSTNLPWPRCEPTLDKAQRIEFQQQLTGLGFRTHGIDGIFGPNTFAALRRYQVSRGLVADGFPTLKILKRF